MHCYTSGKATIGKKKNITKISLISHVMKCLLGADSFSDKCTAYTSGQHTWLLLLRTKKLYSEVHVCMCVGMLVGQRGHLSKNKSSLSTSLPLQANRS